MTKMEVTRNFLQLKMKCERENRGVVLITCNKKLQVPKLPKKPILKELDGSPNTKLTLVQVSNRINHVKRIFSISTLLKSSKI